MKPAPAAAAWLALIVGAAAAAGEPQQAAPAETQRAPAAVGEAAPASREAAEAAAPPAGPAVPAVPVTEAGPQLLIEDLRDGSGSAAASGMSLVVHYTGWLYEPTALGYRGRKFDSSRDRGAPFTFTLGAGRVIPGWEIGLMGLEVGGLRRLVIPPELAYGSRGAGNGLIPPNSTLVFEVELIGVESNTLVEGTG